jgi:hypothetical protein
MTLRSEGNRGQSFTTIRLQLNSAPRAAFSLAVSWQPVFTPLSTLRCLTERNDP